jgi:hypothetical protein
MANKPTTIKGNLDRTRPDIVAAVRKDLQERGCTCTPTISLRVELPPERMPGPRPPDEEVMRLAHVECVHVDDCPGRDLEPLPLKMFTQGADD